jgi:hypothetical protein
MVSFDAADKEKRFGKTAYVLDRYLALPRLIRKRRSPEADRRKTSYRGDTTQPRPPDETRSLARVVTWRLKRGSRRPSSINSTSRPGHHARYRNWYHQRLRNGQSVKDQLSTSYGQPHVLRYVRSTSLQHNNFPKNPFWNTMIRHSVPTLRFRHPARIGKLGTSAQTLSGYALKGA